MLRVIDQNLLRSTLDHLTPNIDELIESAWNENPDLSKQKKTARVQLWLTQNTG
ncbi:MAG: hypothetical protein R3A45_10540 [Bdellovibrionota bacterium]